MRFARDGARELTLYGGLLAALTVLGLATGHPLPALGTALAAAFVLWFFRDPQRTPPDGPGLFVSPADGRVDDVTELEHLDALGGPAVRIGIFLSLVSVHVNRVPERCRVVSVDYSPGRFRSTMRQESVGENENLALLLESTAPHGARFVVRQIAGTLARRIVCRASPGDPSYPQTRPWRNRPRGRELCPPTMAG